MSSIAQSRSHHCYMEGTNEKFSGSSPIPDDQLAEIGGQFGETIKRREAFQVSEDINLHPDSHHLVELASFMHRTLKRLSQSVDLGQIARQNRLSDSSTPMERFMLLDLPHEPVPMLAKKAMSDSGIDIGTIRSGPLSMPDIKIEVKSGLQHSNIDPEELDALSQSVQPQMSNGCRIKRKRVRKRRSNDAVECSQDDHDSKRPKFEDQAKG